jgi:uncharacterized repeat protein (TIGR01451 family)
MSLSFHAGRKDENRMFTASVSHHRSWRSRWTPLLPVLLGLACVSAATAGAASAAPAWRLDAVANSTAAPGGAGDYVVEAINVGNQATGGEVVLTAKLPEGMTAQEASVRAPDGNGGFNTYGCTAGDGSSPVLSASEVRCANSQALTPFGQNGGNWEDLVLSVSVEPGAAERTLTASFGVSGGEAAAVETVAPVKVTSVAPSFGLNAFDAQFTDAAGDVSTQAGGHPDEGSFSFGFTSGTDALKGPIWPVEPVKDLSVDLPPGLVGNPTVTDRCTAGDLTHSIGIEVRPLCPSSSQVGIALLRDNPGGAVDPTMAAPIPVYDMVAPAGVPARFGFLVAGSVVSLDAHLRSGGDYGVTVTARDIPEGVSLLSTTLTIWGVPASPSHDSERACPNQDPPSLGGPTCSTNTAQKAFWRLPTSCTAQGRGLAFAAHLDSWFHPGVFSEEKTWETHELPGFPAAPSEWGAPLGTTGCEKVPFTPTFAGGPVTPQAASASAFSFDLSMPQSEEPEAIGEADLRKAVVTLPEGVQVNPAAANGLAACTTAQIGLHSAGPAACPDAAKIGSVKIETPLLSSPLSGSVYQAAQSENPFGTLLGVYIVAEGSGVTIKLAGRVDLDPTTGRLTTTFDDNPQAPFSDLHLEFFGGANAPLTTPPACGTYRTHAVLTSWSGKTVTTDPAFTIAQGPGGGACGPLGFAPSFTAGTVSSHAGAFSPFLLSFSRTDAEQQIGGLSFTMPPGVAAVLKGVARCAEAGIKAAENETGGCPEASRIGSVTVGSGSGPDPYFLKGTVYLTGPYNNGPFGEVVVVPAVAGPFNLGNVVVRGSIRVDARTAQPTVVSDPFPLFVKSTGIPTDVRRVDVSVDRPGFTFNPTNCNELHATGTLTSAQGATAGVSSRFQAAECRSLAFHPKFTASTQGNTSRKNGASLDVKVGFAPGQANIAKVKVSLPRALPSRLDTLKLACTDAVFEANPAACPAASRVGTAVAKTPVLTATLTGPAYIVSHGGAAFPDVEMVLQGEGVTLVLDGKTDISPKTNITTSTFDTVPDVPVSSFELKLPEGAHSVLGAPGGNLCSKTLVMPTTLTGQNGAVLRQSTRIAVTGCKPAIRVLGHSVKGEQGSIRVAVPFAGTLVASGVGIARSVRHARGARVVTIGVTLGDHARQVLAKNPSQRVNAKVTLRFTPKHGAPLTAHVSLLMG